MAASIAVDSCETFQKLLLEAERNEKLILVHFWATWASQCVHMNEVLEELMKDPSNRAVKWLQVEAESLPKLSQEYNINAVPTFIFIKNKKEVDRIDGANAPELNKKIKQHSQTRPAVPTIPVKDKNDLNERLKALVNHAPCMLFMKGIPSTPRCGFSKQMIEILQQHETDFSSFDILSDEEVRQGLKAYSNWPTYPQLYIDGELIGGIDIVKEMNANGELASILPKKSNLEDRLKKLINRSPITVFMKGTPESPKCGFSRTLVGILNETGLQYDTFNILEDEAVRQGLKTYSNWPTYPQVYVKGDLIGGLDIIKELKEGDELISTLNPQ